MKFVYTRHLNNGIMYQLLKILLTFAHVLFRLVSQNFISLWLNGPTLLEQQVNSISVDNDSDELFEIEEKLTSNLVQTKVQYQGFIKSDHYSSLKKLVLHIACLLKFKKLWLIQKRKLLTKKFPTKLQLKILNKLSSKYSKKPS